MKTSAFLTSLGAFCLCGLPSRAAALQPVGTGEPAVSGFISGRPNLALAASGAVATANTFIPEYFPEYVNDGVTDGSVFPWIPEDGNPDANSVRIELPSPITLSGIVLQGQFDNRASGTYVIQATTDTPPLSDSSTWQDLGTYTFAGGGALPRTALAVPETAGVTGVQVLAKTDSGLGASIQEIEFYGPFDTAPTIATQPVGGSFAEGARAVLQVDATAAQSYQWKKGDADIAGAVGNRLVLDNVKPADAGSYTVVVTNSKGSITSAPAVITVTTAPTFATYREAVLSDTPIHYYPLNDASGTAAEDIGSQPTPGVFTGGISLAQSAVTEKLGKAIRLDGAAGTFVDLGVFHPGDSMTVEAWVRLDTDAPTASYHAVVARWDGSYELDFAPGDIPNFVARNDAAVFGGVAGPAAATRAQWHHLAGVFDAGVLRIYVDGIAGTEASIGGVLQNLGPDPDRVLIGATRNGTVSSFNFKGLIDEVAVYDHALPVEKIRAHYRTALPDQGPELAIVMKAEISWPSFPSGYVLQVADSLVEPVQWREVEGSGPIITVEDSLRTYVPVEEAGRFYRLFRP